MNTQKLVDNLFIKMTCHSLSGKPNTFTNIFKLPITHIDNVYVSVRFEYYPDLTIKLLVETYNMYFQEEDDQCESLLLYGDVYSKFKEQPELFNNENLKIVIDKMMCDLSEIKYDKILDRFCKDNEYGMFDFIKDFKNINCENDCCICMEKTTYKTFCKHSICTPCLSNLKIINEEINCPMCRVCIGQ